MPSKKKSKPVSSTSQPDKSRSSCSRDPPPCTSTRTRQSRHPWSFSLESRPPKRKYTAAQNVDSTRESTHQPESVVSPSPPEGLRMPRHLQPLRPPPPLPHLWLPPPHLPEVVKAILLQTNIRTVTVHLQLVIYLCWFKQQ